MYPGVDPIQKRRDQRDEDRRGDCARKDPDDQGMPLPRPKDARRLEGMMPYAVEELVAVQWNAAGVKEQVTDAYESKEQRKLQRVDDMVCNLRGDKIKA